MRKKVQIDLFDQDDWNSALLSRSNKVPLLLPTWPRLCLCCCRPTEQVIRWELRLEWAKGINHVAYRPDLPYCETCQGHNWPLGRGELAWVIRKLVGRRRMSRGCSSATIDDVVRVLHASPHSVSYIFDFASEKYASEFLAHNPRARAAISGK